jgi:20S proteasome subunit alpha 6
MAIGARSQSARTYLEKHLESFASCDLEQLVLHGLRALRDTLPNEVNLDNNVCKVVFCQTIQSHNQLFIFQNVSIAIVGKDHPFGIFEGEDIDNYLSAIEGEERRGGQAQPADEPAAEQPEDGSMETEDP